MEETACILEKTACILEKTERACGGHGVEGPISPPTEVYSRTQQYPTRKLGQPGNLGVQTMALGLEWRLEGEWGG